MGAGHVQPLLEREHELAVLTDVTSAVAAGASGRDGRGQLLLIEAGTGMGKTALLRQLAELATDRGFRVLEACSSRAETAFTFGVVRQLFERLVHEAPADIADPTAAAARPALEFSPDESPHPSPAVLHGLYRLTDAVAHRTPLALLVDDLQWCDSSSAHFLAYLARRLSRLPVLLAVTVRVDSHWSGRDLAGPDWLEEPGLDLIRLGPGPLSRSAASRLLRRGRLRPLPEAFLDAIHQAGGGNPRLLTELARAAWLQDGDADIGPRAVAAITRLRLASLGSSAVTVARALAVLGSSADPGAIAAVGQLPGAVSDPFLERLIEAELVTGGPPFELTHPRIAESVLSDIAPAQRQVMHRRAADYLIQTCRPAEEIAAHLLALPPRGRPETIAALWEAAETARRRGALDTAVRYLRRAVAESATDHRRAETLAALGSAEALLNDIPSALDHLSSAFDAESDPHRRAGIVGPLARIALFARPADDALGLLQHAIADLPPGSLRTGLRAIHAYATSIAGIDDESDLPPPPIRCAHLGDRLSAAACAWHTAMRGGPAGEAAELAERALADGSLVASDWAYMAMVASTVLVLAGRDQTADVWGAVQRSWRDPATQLADGGVLVWQSWVLLERGLPREALSTARSYLRQLNLQGGAVADAGADYGHGLELRALVELGDLAEARELSQATPARRVGSDGDLHRRRAVIELLLAERRYDEAEHALDRLQRLRPAIANPIWLPVSRMRVETLIGLGRSGAAVDTARSGVAAAQRWGTTLAIGIALRALGEAQEATKDEASLTTLTTAADLLRQTARTLEWARAAVSWGSALRRRGQLVDARPVLAEAAGIADDRGCRRLAENAVAELRAAGGRRDSALRTGLAALTERELTVGRLAATGLTNRQIGLELHVGVKTVETHLSSVYRKLQVSGRAELPPLPASKGGSASSADISGWCPGAKI